MTPEEYRVRDQERLASFELTDAEVDERIAASHQRMGAREVGFSDAQRRAAEGQAQDPRNPWITPAAAARLREEREARLLEQAIARADRLRCWTYFAWGAAFGVSMTLIGIVVIG